MNGYFPYSAIVDLYRSVKQSISRPLFATDWYVADESRPVALSNGMSEISEIYY